MLSVLHIKRGVYRGSDYSLQLQKSPFYRLQNMKIGLSSIQSTFGFYGLITYAIDSHLRVITVTSLLHIQNTIIILIIITIYCKEAPIYFSNIFFSLLGLAYFPPLECFKKAALKIKKKRKKKEIKIRTSCTRFRILIE